VCYKVTRHGLSSGSAIGSPLVARHGPVSGSAISTCVQYRHANFSNWAARYGESAIPPLMGHPGLLI
jgi:hypothetical protein